MATPPNDVSGIKVASSWDNKSRHRISSSGDEEGLLSNLSEDARRRKGRKKSCYLISVEGFNIS